MQLTVMPKYERYKESGVDWIGDIPSGWDLLKAKFLWEEIEARSDHGDEQLLSVSQYAGITPRESESRSEELSGYKLVQKDDLVTNIMLAWMGGLGVSDFHGIVSPAYSVYRLLKQANPKYLHYLYRTTSYLAEFARRSSGIVPSRWRMYTEDFGQVATVLPPIETQNAITAFLDDKTAKIDEAIAIKERQIALLKERKQIIIQDAVTKGLNPDAPMKDSGVDWIGQIPAHWEVRRFKFLCSITTGGRNTEDKQENGTYPFFVRSQKPERISSYSFDGEAVLTAGDGAGVGKVFHYYDGKFDFHQRVYKFSDFKHILGKYGFYYLRENFFNVALLGMAKSTVDSLRLPLIQDFIIAFPTTEAEQQMILEEIERVESRIDGTISIKEQQISKLKEYKTTLINSAVTGKIRVV